MAEIEHKFSTASDKNLYFHKETIYYSIEGRKMDMMTITSRDGITDERESIPEDGVFPDAVDDPSKRPYKFNSSKKVVIFTSRVHPGESPGSHVLNGAINLITDLKSE
jgi:cytosolic carboxypeptidase protein 5